MVRGVTQALLTAFGTDSSAATLPTTIECVEKLGINKMITRFTCPIGEEKLYGCVVTYIGLFMETFFLAFSLCFLLYTFLGSDPDRRRCPVEWGEIAFVCLYVHPPLAKPARASLNASQSGLGDSKASCPVRQAI